MERDVGLRLLAATPWLSRTPIEFREALLSSSRWRKHEAGALVTLGGEEASDVIGTASGVVEFSTVFGASDTPMLTLGHAVIDTATARTANPIRLIDCFADMMASIISCSLVVLRLPCLWEQ